MLKTISNSLMTIQPLMVRQCQEKKKIMELFWGNMCMQECDSQGAAWHGWLNVEQQAFRTISFDCKICTKENKHIFMFFD